MRTLTERFHDDAAQDAIEYLLAVGGIVVLLVGGLLGLNALIPEVLGHLCPAVDTANPLVVVGSCLGLT